MRKYLRMTLVLGSVSVFLVGTWLFFSSESASAGKDVVPLEPRLSFDLHDSLGDQYRGEGGSWGETTRALGFVARPTGLYFLLSELGNQTIVHTTHEGAYVSTIASGPAPIRGFDVDAGRVFVLDDNELQVYGQGGKLEEQCAMNLPVADVCILNGRPLCVGPKGDVYYLRPKGYETIATVQGGSYLRLASLPGDAFVLVNGVEARFHLGRLASGITGSFSPGIPEIARAQAWYHGMPEGQRGVILYDVATNQAGKIYIPVAGASALDEGYPVVEISEGNRYRTLNCSIPTYERFKHPKNPLGHMMPVSIGIVHDQLFLVDSRGAVAVYSVEM